MIDKKINELENLDSISKRLKYIVDTLGVKQSHMAEKLGVSPSGLHYILNNDVKFSKNAKKIAKFLKISEEWLATGSGEIYEENTSIKIYKIPIYYIDQLKIHYCSQQKNNIKTTDFFLTTTAYSEKVIGVYVTDSSFSPKFEVGDSVIFEQSKCFKDGEILLIYLAKTSAIVLKYAFHAANDIILISLDDAPLKLSLSSGDEIIGAYRECLKKSLVFD
jgi:transcriptional regulator with XRE-family HTH domain